MKLGRRTFAAILPAGATAVLRPQNAAPDGLPQLNSELVKDSISQGADARIKAANGGTALALSPKRGDTSITQALKDAGATE
jgi:hypothetical protein